MDEGKCRQLHGHTWTVILSLYGEPDDRGMLFEYGELKRRWRGWLDDQFDHRMVLDTHDPLLTHYTANQIEANYPGTKTVTFEPTVENLCKYFIANAVGMFGTHFGYKVELWEGENNAAVATQ